MTQALTEAQWSALYFGREDWRAIVPELAESGTWEIDWQDIAERHDRHGLAAFALYGQPFGFTHDDAKLIRDMADAIWPESKRGAPAYSQAHALADRIVALLPERGSAT